MCPPERGRKGGRAAAPQRQTTRTKRRPWWRWTGWRAKTLMALLSAFFLLSISFLPFLFFRCRRPKEGGEGKGVQVRMRKKETPETREVHKEDITV